MFHRAHHKSQSVSLPPASLHSKLARVKDLAERGEILSTSVGIGSLNFHRPNNNEDYCLAGSVKPNHIVTWDSFDHLSPNAQNAVLCHEIGHLTESRVKRAIAIYAPYYACASFVLSSFGVVLSTLLPPSSIVPPLVAIGSLTCSFILFETSSLIRRELEYRADKFAARMVGVDQCLSMHYEVWTIDQEEIRKLTFTDALVDTIWKFIWPTHPSYISRIRRLENLRDSGEVPT
jgi:Zn-dependent protease with chaperone function